MMAISAVLATAIMARHWLGPVLERLTDPAQFGQFLIHYHRLLNGTTAYRYIAGSGWADDSWTSLPQWDLMLSDVATWTVSALVLFTLWQQARRNWSSREACLLASWGAMLMGFYLVAGVGAIQPHYERYAICLIAPAIAMAARAIEIRCQGAEGQRFCLPVGLALAWLLLLGFGTHYFGFFYRTGGRSHDTFRCGVVEPKSAALNHIVCQSTGADPVWIVTSQYWNDRPLAYLASAHRHLRVGPLERFEHSAERTTALATSRVWHVEFAGSAEYRDTLAMLDKRGMSYEETAIADFAGRPVLMLVRPKGKRATAADQIAALPTTSEVDGPRE
jgi:hypothetical protein